MKLNKELLHDSSEFFHTYHGDIKGLYSSMQFVLRLNPDIHDLLDGTPMEVVKSSEINFDVIQAFSTYLHETIHWWQHIGSTCGLLLSLSILLPTKTKLIQSEYSNKKGEYFLWEKAERGLPKKRRKSSSRV